MAKGNLNDPIIRNYSTPEKRTEVPDGDGLYLRITEKGHKSFVYRYRFNDKVKRYTIGSYPAVSLAMARDKAGELSVDVSNGIDPLAEKMKRRRQPDVITVRDLAEDFKRDYLPKKKPSTQTTYTSRINKITDKFGNVPLDEVTATDIKRWLKKIANKQPVNANRLQAIFSKMFSFATSPDQGYTRNHPLKGMDKVGGKEKEREVTYTPENIRELWNSFSDQAEPMNSLLKILLLTGQRLGETSRMRWDQIDRKHGLWIIPKTEAKGGKDHVVPLSESVIEILENVHQLTGKSDYVFASPIKDNEPLSHFAGVTNRIRKYPGLESFKIHDLRHIAITEMIRIGIDFVHVGKTVAHKGLGKEYAITSRYSHYDYLDEKRQALNRWSYHLNGILDGETETKFFKIG